MFLLLLLLLLLLHSFVSQVVDLIDTRLTQLGLAQVTTRLPPPREDVVGDD